MGVVFWSHLDPQKAKRLARQWEAGRPARLRWLESRVGSPLERSPTDLDAAWDWFLTWRLDPVGASDQPTPEWWSEWTGAYDSRGRSLAQYQHFERDVSVGLDALGHLFEEVVVSMCPQVERWFVPAGSLKSPWEDQNRPCLGVRRSRPWHGRTHEDVADVMIWIHGWGDALVKAPDDARRITPRTCLEGAVARYERALTAGPPPTLAEQVASEPPFEWVRDSDDPSYPYRFEFDDVISHEHEDLVVRFVEALRSRPDISDVAHLDREVVGISGRVKVRDLRHWAWDWWKANVPQD